MRAEVELPLQQAVEFRKVVRRQGSHSLYTIGSQVAVRLAALTRRPPVTPSQISNKCGLIEPYAISSSQSDYTRISNISHIDCTMVV
jgi:hypothetical protein